MRLGLSLAITQPIPRLSAYDPDAAAYFAAAGITDPAQKNAWNTAVVDLKAANLWTKLNAIYPFLGGSAVPHSFNAKNPAQFQITWHGTVTHSANGITGNGTTGFGNTGIVPATDLSLNSVSMSFYARTNADAFVTGAINGGDAFSFYGPDGGGTVYSDIWNTTTGRASVNVGSALKLNVGTRTSNMEIAYYLDGVSEISSVLSDSSGMALPTSSIYILGANSGGSLSFPSSSNLAFAAYGLGLSAGNVATYTTIIDTFQAALGRNV